MTQRKDFEVKLPSNGAKNETKQRTATPSNGATKKHPLKTLRVFFVSILVQITHDSQNFINGGDALFGFFKPGRPQIHDILFS